MKVGELNTIFLLINRNFVILFGVTVKDNGNLFSFRVFSYNLINLNNKLYHTPLM